VIKYEECSHPLRNGIRSLIPPHISTEIEGVQLSKLDAKGLDELALLIADRSLLVSATKFSKNQKPEDSLKVVRHFGRTRTLSFWSRL
jgi:hypothetical protein